MKPIWNPFGEWLDSGSLHEPTSANPYEAMYISATRFVTLLMPTNLCCIQNAASGIHTALTTPIVTQWRPHSQARVVQISLYQSIFDQETWSSPTFLMVFLYFPLCFYLCCARLFGQKKLVVESECLHLPWGVAKTPGKPSRFPRFSRV